VPVHGNDRPFVIALHLALGLFGGLVACRDAVEPTCTGERLFGRPTATTGLGADQCGPSCSCQGVEWTAPAYTSADADALLAWQLLDPPPLLDADPYAGALPAPGDPDTVCAVVPDAPGSRSYRLETFDSEQAAIEVGAIVTHHDACGQCSSLADLAVYMRYPDLTGPVRQCGTEHLNDSPELNMQCLAALGFTAACAQIWYFNVVATRDACTAPCFFALNEPYHLPDGTLNECLRCDEEHSGPVFKAVAGRTRRNTGVASSMCRPCSEVRPLFHNYP
jgi:hypothetical protein